MTILFIFIFLLFLIQNWDNKHMTHHEYFSKTSCLLIFSYSELVDIILCTEACIFKILSYREKLNPILIHELSTFPNNLMILSAW